MKKSKLTTPIRLLLLLLCLAAAVPQLTAAIIVAGNNTALFGGSWTTTPNLSNQMKQHNSTNYYYLTKSNVSLPGNLEFKVVDNNNWYGSGNNGSGGNVSCNATGTHTITFLYDAGSHQVDRIGTFSTDVIVAGTDTQTLGASWDNTNLSNAMTTSDGLTFTLTRTAQYTSSGSMQFKVHSVTTDQWYGTSSGGNVYYTIPEAGEYEVTYTFNVITREVNANVTPVSSGPTTPTYYITGDNGLGLGGFKYNPTTTMTYDSANDIYTYNYNVTTAGNYYFVFSDGQGSSWNDFNDNHRIGPSSGNVEVSPDGTWVNTQKGGGSYFVNVDAGPVTITLDASSTPMRFKVEGTTPTVLVNYYVKGDDTTIFPNGWNTGTNTAMTDNGDGTYTWESGQFHLAAGASYAYKVWGDDGSWHPSGANATFSSNVQGNYTVTINYDSNNGTVTHQLNLVQEDQSYTYNIRVRYTGSESLGNVYLHAWDAAGDKTNWPGTAFSGMTTTEENGHTYYCATFTSYSQTLNLLFNENGSGDTKTADLTAQPGTSYFTYGGGSTVSGPNQAADEADPTYDYTIYVRYKGNATPHEYLWDGAGTLLGDFPGKELTDASTFTTEVINGYTYYKYSVNASDYAQLGMILNEGDDSHKTTDLTVEPGTSYFTYGGGSTVSGPNADADPTITYYAESSFAGWTTEGTQMTANGDGSYSKTFTGVSLSSGTTYEYKVYGADGTDEGVWIGDNVTFTPPMGGTYDVTITLNSDGTVSHTLTMTAAGTVYINGDGVLGSFAFAPDKAMTYTDNGIYTYTATVTDPFEYINFVFASGQGEDWTDFNNHYRIGPSNGSQNYVINSGYTATQMAGGDNGSYRVRAAAGTVTFYFDALNMQFKVEGTEAPVTYYVVGDDTDIFPNGWNTGNGTAMTLEGNVYTWTSDQVSLTKGTTYEYKVLGDDGVYHPVNSDNLSFTPSLTGDYTVTVTYDIANETITATLNLVGTAPYYIEGSEGLGLSWGYAPTTQMTLDPSTGILSYTCTVAEDGTYNFMFANGQGSNWDDFNANYRIGPQSGDQNIDIDGNWVTTQMAGTDGGSYQINCAAGQVTIYFNPATMKFMVEAAPPTYQYTFYVIATDGTTVPYLYLWDNAQNVYTNSYPGNELTTTEVLADGKTWHKWSGTILVDVLNAIVSGGGSNADNTKTKNITNFEPGTYYIVWTPERGEGEEYNHFELYNEPPSATGDHQLFIHGGYYHAGETFSYGSNIGSEMKYDANTGNYYINNVTLSSNATFCFSTQLGSDWQSVGTRFGNGGPTYTDNPDGTNYLEVNPSMINENMPLNEWSETYGEYKMFTAGVFNILVNPTEHWVKLIKTDHKNLSPMNVYLEQTPNVQIDNIQEPGTTYTTTIMGEDYWPLSAYNQEQGLWNPHSDSQHYPVTYMGDTTTVDGKKWWHWQVSASIAEVFFTRTNKEPYQSETIHRHAGVLWYTWDEVNGQTVMTDHTREYFEAAANALPSNVVVMEGHYYVYFINTLGWDQVFCYAWDEADGQYTDGYNRVMESWPGHICELMGIDPVTGYEVWRYDFGTISSIENQPDGILFNDGDTNALSDSKEQTGDFEYINGGVYDYLGLFDGAYTLNNLIRTAAEEVRYTVSNDLLGVYYDRDAVTTIHYTNKYGEPVSETITGALYAKDLNQYGEKSFLPDDSFTDYVYDVCGSSHTAGGSQIMDKRTTYDQSNWVKLVMSPNYDGRTPVPVTANERPDLSQYVNKIIPAGQLDVFMTDTINPTAHVLSIGMGQGMSYEPNVYVSASFNDTIVFSYTHNEWMPKNAEYTGTYRTKPHIEWIFDPETGEVLRGEVTREVLDAEPRKMFYVAPKPQEVAYLTWIVYDNLNIEENQMKPYGDYVSGEYQPYTSVARFLPQDPGRFYAPKNWDRSKIIPGEMYEQLQYLSEDQLENALGGYGSEYGPYSNGYMQYGGMKVNWSLFDEETVGMPWWQIFQPGQAYKIKAIIRYARGNGEGYQPNECYGPSNGDNGTTGQVLNGPRRIDGNGQGNYANMYFTSEYKGLEDSKFIIFPIEASPNSSNGDPMGNVTTVKEVKASRSVVSVRYYNLMGIESDKPFNGINIVVTTYNDGSRSSRKILR